MAANLNVTYAEMRDAASYLQSGQSELEATLSRLEAHIQGLVAGGFVTDQASGAFNETYYNFTRAAKECVANLYGLSNFLTSAAETMEYTDSSLASAIRGQ